jgi:hypothetical protein
MGIGLTRISGLQFPGEPDRLAVMRAPSPWILLRIAPILLLGVSAGCDPVYLDLEECPAPDNEHLDADGEPDPCHFRDPDAGAACDGICVPLSPPGWSETVLLWHGAPADLPQCPSWAPAHSKEGQADLTPPVTSCLACECQPPTGACMLPATITASTSTSCAIEGNTWTSFDPAAGWVGACTQENAIPMGQLCGGVPCVQAISVGPLIVTESGCTPTIPTPPGPPPGPADSPAWGTVALACSSNHGGQCSDPGETCAPNAPPPPPGFQVCVAAFGDQDCFDAFPDKHVFYKDFHDGRACTPCTCDAPSGSTCSGAISVFNDSMCGAPLPLLVLTAVNTGPTCGQVPAGSGLASKSAGPLTYTAGMCKPNGGEPTGTVELIKPKTFCCQP